MTCQCLLVIKNMESRSWSTESKSIATGDPCPALWENIFKNTFRPKEDSGVGFCVKECMMGNEEILF